METNEQAQKDKISEEVDIACLEKEKSDENPQPEQKPENQIEENDEQKSENQSEQIIKEREEDDSQKIYNAINNPDYDQNPDEINNDEQNENNEINNDNEQNENNEINQIPEVIQTPLSNFDMAKSIIGSLAYKRNYNEAAKYFLLAIDDGDVRGYNEYGLLLKSGNGFDAPNKPEAFKYFKMGAENGEKEAMRNCGIMFRDGVGVEQNLSEAKRYLNMAVSAGDEGSSQLLVEINARETQKLCLTDEQLNSVTNYKWLFDMDLENNQRNNGFVIEREMGDQNASKACLLI